MTKEQIERYEKAKLVKNGKLQKGEFVYQINDFKEHLRDDHLMAWGVLLDLIADIVDGEVD